MSNNKVLKEAKQAIKNASTYQAYKDACLLHDSASGADEWKAKDVSNEYDHKLINKRVSRIRAAKANKDVEGLMFILHEGIHGNLGNIANPELNRHSLIGTKKLICVFLDEVTEALDLIFNADEQEIDFYEKLAFFEETGHAFGQSCLMLSGGAGLGFFHCGVVKTLIEHDLMPQVISGSSAGSIIAGLLATNTNEELKTKLEAEFVFERFNSWGVWRGFSGDSLMDSTNVENALIEIFDLMTFGEAYEKTGRDVTITVSPADLHQRSRLLNARTSPNAIITQAVRASSAIPYLFTPVQLKAKNRNGDIVPYIPNRKFTDGSIMADLPFNRLARLYGVNHSIVSQVNPMVTPFISKQRTNAHKKNIWSLTKDQFSSIAKSNSIYGCNLLENVVNNQTAKLGIHKIRSVIDQQYIGDINILPENSLSNFKHVFANPTISGINKLIKSGERETWSQLDNIERSTRLSKTFRKYLNALRIEEEKKLTQ